MTQKRTNLLDAARFPQVIDLLPPGAVAHLGILEPVPVVKMKLADQRKWCVRAQAWLDGEPFTPGCPTRDLREDGSCMRSPAGGRCLLLLPFAHPDWLPATRWRFDKALGALVDRSEPVTFPNRLPLALEQMEVAHADA